MALVIELHPDIKELQEDVLRALIPLDQPISAKQHHVSCVTIQSQLIRCTGVQVDQWCSWVQLAAYNTFFHLHLDAAALAFLMCFNSTASKHCRLIHVDYADSLAWVQLLQESVICRQDQRRASTLPMEAFPTSLSF